MNGVDFYCASDNKVCVCVVRKFTTELKEALKKNLQSICEGGAHVKKYPGFFSYENTLITFLDRFKEKSPNIKVGIIGELLCHVLIPVQHSHLKAISPFFNLEEGSIKKGHDLVYSDASGGNVWVVEVKSGSPSGSLPAVKKKGALLSKANTDLKVKLSSKTTNLWRNAFKGMDTVLEDGVTKNSVVNLLTDYHQKTLKGLQKPSDYNAIIASTLFGGPAGQVQISDVEKWYNDNLSNCDYNAHIVFSVQKETLEKIVNFLEEEVQDFEKAV